MILSCLGCCNFIPNHHTPLGFFRFLVPWYFLFRALSFFPEFRILWEGQRERKGTKALNGRERVKWITIILERKRVTLGCHDKRAKIYFSLLFSSLCRALVTHEKKRSLYFWAVLATFILFLSFHPTVVVCLWACASASKKIIRGTSAKNNFPRGCRATARAALFLGI